MNGRQTITEAKATSRYYLTEAQVAVIAADPQTRRTLLQVRCFAPAEDVKHFSKYVREVSIIYDPRLDETRYRSGCTCVAGCDLCDIRVRPSWGYNADGDQIPLAVGCAKHPVPVPGCVGCSPESDIEEARRR